MPSSVSEKMKLIRAMRPMLSAEQRFWPKVQLSSQDGCWLWTGAVTAAGYGMFGRGKRGEGNFYAHRFSFTLHGGVLTPDKELDHLCRNRSCVNPAHLELVTRRTNHLRGNHPSAIRYRQRGGLVP